MLLEIEQLRKNYGDVVANDNIDLHMARGSVVGLLGPNGAGKTTLVRQVLGLSTPTAGTIRLAGRDAVADPRVARAACSYQPQSAVAAVGLTPRQAISLIGRLRGGERRATERRTDDLLTEFELTEWADRRMSSASGGVVRLVMVCMAAVQPGELVILDEPTNDVDPVRRRVLYSLIRRLADDGTSVLLVTHNIVEAEPVVDKIAIIDGGRILAYGSPRELAGSHALLRVILDLPESVALPDFLVTTERRPTRTTATTTPEQVRAFVDWAETARRHGILASYSLAPLSLEDSYLRVVSKVTA